MVVWFNRRWSWSWVITSHANQKMKLITHYVFRSYICLCLFRLAHTHSDILHAIGHIPSHILSIIWYHAGIISEKETFVQFDNQQSLSFGRLHQQFDISIFHITQMRLMSISLFNKISYCDHGTMVVTQRILMKQVPKRSRHTIK